MEYLTIESSYRSRFITNLGEGTSLIIKLEGRLTTSPSLKWTLEAFRGRSSVKYLKTLLENFDQLTWLSRQVTLIKIGKIKNMIWLRTLSHSRNLLLKTFPPVMKNPGQRKLKQVKPIRTTIQIKME